MDQTTINEIIFFLKGLLINEGVKVESIALFGSALNGKMDIDIDIIIVSSDFSGLDIIDRAKLTMKPEIETMKKYKVPMDIINLTPDEYLETSNKLFYQSKIVA